MDIVKLPTGKYALRKRFLIGKYGYADKDSLDRNTQIYWWSKKSTKAWYSYESLEDLERAVDNYNPALVKQMKKERKLKLQDVVLTKSVKFGCKNPLIKTPL